MRALWMVPFLSLAACEPLADPAVPSSDGKPCHSDEECQIPGEERSVRQGICAQRSTMIRANHVDDAACGPIGNMSPATPEPQALCFKGTCVAVGTKR